MAPHDARWCIIRILLFRIIEEREFNGAVKPNLDGAPWRHNDIYCLMYIECCWNQYLIEDSLQLLENVSVYPGKNQHKNLPLKSAQKFYCRNG